MRMSRLFSKTLREAPNGADCKGYEYLLRAGYIDQLAAGIFSLLPLGFRSIQKISSIVREEMNALGAQEILMPVVNPGDLWKETGRFYSIDREMSRFKDRNDRDMCLAMTHEECATDLGRNVIDSYKRLPLLVYQLQTKWRDDPRPRAGLIRVREFTMKDSYSFDKDQEGLEKEVRSPRHSGWKRQRHDGRKSSPRVHVPLTNWRRHDHYMPCMWIHCKPTGRKVPEGLLPRESKGKGTG